MNSGSNYINIESYIIDKEPLKINKLLYGPDYIEYNDSTIQFNSTLYGTYYSIYKNGKDTTKFIDNMFHIIPYKYIDNSILLIGNDQMENKIYKFITI
jgi:hypothetical protein